MTASTELTTLFAYSLSNNIHYCKYKHSWNPSKTFFLKVLLFQKHQQIYNFILGNKPNTKYIQRYQQSNNFFFKSSQLMAPHYFLHRPCHFQSVAVYCSYSFIVIFPNRSRCWKLSVKTWVMKYVEMFPLIVMKLKRFSGFLELDQRLDFVEI